MKKLGKKLATYGESIEGYACGSDCGCNSLCNSYCENCYVGHSSFAAFNDDYNAFGHHFEILGYL